MTNGINYGQFSEALNNKADIDLRNINTNKCDMVIEYQEPTEENNYTWYRLYATGWVEQGGLAVGRSSVTIDLLVTMANTNYDILTQSYQSSGYYSTWTVYQQSLTTSSFQVQTDYAGDSKIAWYVYGKADMTGHEILPAVAEHEEFEHRVVLFQKPTAENNYTWYRKYADGWVEQGGISVTTSENPTSVTYPVVMSDSNYTLNVSAQTPLSTTASTIHGCHYIAKETTRCTIACLAGNSGDWVAGNISWQVSGMAAA